MSTRAKIQKKRRKKKHGRPQDAPPQNNTTVTVTIDGHTVHADFDITQNVQVMRRIRKGDMDAMLDLVDRMFGDQVDDIETRFNLVTIEDWGNFIHRIGEAVPNS